MQDFPNIIVLFLLFINGLMDLIHELFLNLWDTLNIRYAKYQIILYYQIVHWNNGVI